MLCQASSCAAAQRTFFVQGANWSFPFWSLKLPNGLNPNTALPQGLAASRHAQIWALTFFWRELQLYEFTILWKSTNRPDVAQQDSKDSCFWIRFHDLPLETNGKSKTMEFHFLPEHWSTKLNQNKCPLPSDVNGWYQGLLLKTPPGSSMEMSPWHTTLTIEMWLTKPNFPVFMAFLTYRLPAMGTRFLSFRSTDLAISLE